MKTTIGNALRLFILLSLFTGLLYPLGLTGLLEFMFPRQANGSLVTVAGKVAGSALLGQKLSSAAYFWPRPSAADHATVPSGASNQGPTSRTLQLAVRARTAALQTAHGLPPSAPVPADLVFASGSGLDPDISPAAAEFQVGRIARERHFTPAQTQSCRALVARMTARPQFGLLGQPRVNVLLLNRELDELE